MREQDLVIALLVLAVSGISTLLQKRRQAREQRDLTPPDHPAAPATARTSEPSRSEPKSFDLEEQLRRILEGDRPVQPTVSQPPVIRQPHPAPPPLPTIVPSEVIYTETEEPAARAMGQLAESAKAYARAAQLSEAMAARLRQVDEATEQARPVQSIRPHRAPSPAIAAAVAQLRAPQTAQQAFVTATILGPSKALASSEN